MNFASDNAAGVAPSILAAIAVANTGFAIGYGDDAISQRLERRMCELFERDVAVFLVTTGTAANALALAHLSPPWGAVLGHAEAHAMVHECGAPEFFGHGLRLVGTAGRQRQAGAGDGCGRARPAIRTAAAPAGACGGHDYASERIRRRVPHRGDRGAGAPRPCARDDAAHGRRPLRQCGRPPGRDAGGSSAGGPAWTCCRSGRPKAGRWGRRPWCSSIRRAAPQWRSGASAAVTCYRSTVSWRRSSTPFSPARRGSRSPRMPTAWRIVWPPD